ncbi:unnamed protein product, partial [Candidula unifasciata]
MAVLLLSRSTLKCHFLLSHLSLKRTAYEAQTCHRSFTVIRSRNGTKGLFNSVKQRHLQWIQTVGCFKKI